jgi:hypothetical protein
VTTLKRRGRRGWTVTIDGRSHEGLTLFAALRAAADDVATDVVGDVARITSPRPTPGEPTISDEDTNP